MGVLSGKDLFSSKHITAVIINSSMRSFFVPIKFVIGDYFLTVLDKRLYVFRMNEKIITYRHTAVRSFRWYIYTTDHYLPLAPNQLKEMEVIMAKNDLPRMNMMLFNILKYLGRREKAQFEAHKIVSLIEELTKHEDQYSEEIRSIMTYLDHLNIEQVVTPVRKLSEFVEDNMITPDPKFFGDVVNFFKNTDIDFKKINNEPVSGKTPWLKWLAIMMGIGLVIAVGYMAVSSGTFDGMLPDFSQIKPLSLTPPGSGDSLMSKYPDPVDLRLACDRGEVNCDTLPQNVKDMLKNVKLPTATPSNQVVNLTP